jgi:phosphopantothenoylcysteine synthetase/decarboxylase
MWQHAATQQNVAKLKARGAEFIGPEEGLLAVRIRRTRAIVERR